MSQVALALLPQCAIIIAKEIKIADIINTI
jgi:hypothetical protein